MITKFIYPAIFPWKCKIGLSPSPGITVSDGESCIRLRLITCEMPKLLMGVLPPSASKRAAKEAAACAEPRQPLFNTQHDRKHALLASRPHTRRMHTPFQHLGSDVTEELHDHPADEHTVDGQVNEGQGIGGTPPSRQQPLSMMEHDAWFRTLQAVLRCCGAAAQLSMTG